MSEKIRAPFTNEQVEGLKAWQEAGHVHPFTCGVATCRETLVPTEEGWVCPREGCGYRQDWAHDFMADGPPDMTSFL